MHTATFQRQFRCHHVITRCGTSSVASALIRGGGLIREGGLINIFTQKVGLFERGA